MFRLKLPKMLYAYQPVEALKGTRASQQISRSDLVPWRKAEVPSTLRDFRSSSNNRLSSAVGRRVGEFKPMAF